MAVGMRDLSPHHTCSQLFCIFLQIGYRLIEKIAFYIITGYYSIKLDCIRGKNAKNKPQQTTSASLSLS